MKKEFVPYDLALAVKELGFREECLGFYDDILNNNETEHRLFPIRTQTLTDKMLESLTPAPLYQQAFRWLMDNSYDENGDSLIQDYLDTRWFRTLYSPVHQDITLRECIRIFKQELTNQNKDE